MCMSDVGAYARIGTRVRLMIDDLVEICQSFEPLFLPPSWLNIKPEYQTIKLSLSASWLPLSCFDVYRITLRGFSFAIRRKQLYTDGRIN